MTRWTAHTTEDDTTTHHDSEAAAIAAADERAGEIDGTRWDRDDDLTPCRADDGTKWAKAKVDDEGNLFAVVCRAEDWGFAAEIYGLD